MDIENLEGSELDAAVAERVMGWEGNHDIRHCEDPWYNYCRNGGCYESGASNEEIMMQDPLEDDPLTGCKGYPSYSTDIAAAWRVVEKMREMPLDAQVLRLTVYPYNRTYATFNVDIDDDDWAEGNGVYHTPLAICRAALRAVESE